MINNCIYFFTISKRKKSKQTGKSTQLVLDILEQCTLQSRFKKCKSQSSKNLQTLWKEEKNMTAKERQTAI